LNGALEHALNVYSQLDSMSHDRRCEAAIALSGYGLFSRNHIEAITGLTEHYVKRLIEKPEKTGGRFNAGYLSLMYDFVLEYEEQDIINSSLLKNILDNGTSQGFLAKLSGIPQQSISRWARNGGR
jgi:hypothetical protein